MTRRPGRQRRNGGSALAARLVERIRRMGPIPFDQFVDAALYDPEGGFFVSGAGAGTAGGDFLTSPEVGPLFGSLVARALDGWWDDLGQPDPYLVVEAGAGRGHLALAVLRASPRCASALRYVMVERSAILRERQRDWLAVEPASEALGPVLLGEDPEATPEPVTGLGPIVCSLETLPAGPVTGVLFANELLDNLAFRVVERSTRSPTGWNEVRVATDTDHRGEDRFVESVVPAEGDLAAEADSLVAGAELTDGTRLPVQREVAAFLHNAAGMLRRGFVVIVDYIATVTDIVERGPEHGWLRTYVSHGSAGHPLADPGSRDITCDVLAESLNRAAARAGLRAVNETTQERWLLDLGVEDIVRRARDRWRERAAIGDLEAVAARSAVGEAEALLDPTGLGARTVAVFRR